MDFEIIKIMLALVVLVNPFSALPMFLQMTRNIPDTERKKIASTASITILMTVVFFTFFGKILLQFLGISIGSFRVAGGILVFLIAINMMNGDGNPVKPDKSDVSEENIGHASAIVPFAIPMIIGPGGISTVVIYASVAVGYKQLGYIIIAGSLIAIFNYLILIASTKVSRFLGESGLNILSRVMGLLLAAVAVEIAVAGIKSIFHLT